MKTILSLILCTCFGLQGAIAADTPRTEPLIFGVHPYLSPKKIFDKFSPLTKRLSEQLGRTVSLQIGKDYAEHVEQFKQGKLDMAYFGPAGYVELTTQVNDIPLLARLEINNKPTFRGAIVTTDMAKLKTLTDLKGKRFAFGSKHSTMSYLVPRYTLEQAGVSMDSLSTHDFLGNHDDVALGVLIGDFDAGGVKEAVYHKYQAKGLRLLAWTPEISEHVFVAKKGMAAAQVKAIQDALFALKKSEVLTNIKSTITALVPVKDSDYDNLRAIIKQVK